MSRKAGFQIGWRRCNASLRRAEGGCGLARNSACGSPGAGEAPRRHPLPKSREAPLGILCLSAPLLLCVKNTAGFTTPINVQM